MLRTFACLGMLGLAAALPQRATDDMMTGPGVPLVLAEDRAARISNVRYDLHFTVPPDLTEKVRGRATIRFTLSDASKAVALDFVAPDGAVRQADGNSITRAGEHLIVGTERLKRGDNEITIEFDAPDAALNRNPEFLYTLFVPARARLAFPCFDQPDIKAKYTLTLDLPAGWQAVANGAETARSERDSLVRVSFAETQPIPTYLFAFGAGRFQVETAERNGRQFRMFHRETDRAKVARNRDAIFDLHAAALTWLEDYTAIPYPFGKFDFLLVPSFQFGGMEHPGSIFYNASGLLLDESATQNQKLGRASLIAHETAHMWFGDLVTMRWFNDVWMKEVFANFMAAKIVNPSFPGINHQLRFLYSHYPAAYDVDRTPGTNAIRQPLENLNEAGSLYGAIIYQKAPVVMRQLEMIVGEQSLRDGLRDYLRAHSFGNATWRDLIALLDARTPEDLDAWSRAWVEEAGRPVIETSLATDAGRITSLSIAQRDPAPRRGLTWTQQLEVVLAHGRETTVLPVRLAGGTVQIQAARGLPEPDFVLPSGGGIGYGGFILPPASRLNLLAKLPEIADPLTRGSALVVLWEEMLDGRVPPSDMLDTLLRAVAVERDELNVQRMLTYAQQAYWRFLPLAERNAIAPRMEQVFGQGLDTAATPSLKSAWFSALRDTALTPATLARLERVWRRDETVPGLVLAEPDYITLSLELAVRGLPAWRQILEEQHSRIQNPDRKARFAFVRPAMSPDASVRDKFFASLADVSNRRREPWVLEGLAYLHHPLRADSADKYIPESLEMLPEIQRTGDIFFPKRWLDATLSGHSSARAAQIVREHLAKLPAGYPDRLRRIILSSADDLFRASR